MEGATSDVAGTGDSHPGAATVAHESVLTLTVTALGSLHGQRFVLGDGELTVGRASTSDIRIDDPYVSRRHAVIHRAQDEVAIEDANSIAGVLVNGDRITGRTTLRVGDRIKLGSIELELQRNELSPDSARSEGAAAPPSVSPETSPEWTPGAEPETQGSELTPASHLPLTAARRGRRPDLGNEFSVPAMTRATQILNRAIWYVIANPLASLF
jgi:predicted component of type VI protein secretion system